MIRAGTSFMVMHVRNLSLLLERRGAANLQKIVCRQQIRKKKSLYHNVASLYYPTFILCHNQTIENNALQVGSPLSSFPF